MSGLRLPTTWHCSVEVSYLLGVPQRYELLRWVELGGVVLYPFGTQHLVDMVWRMENYTEPGKREMDFADALLYWLALETGGTGNHDGRCSRFLPLSTPEWAGI